MTDAMISDMVLLSRHVAGPSAPQEPPLHHGKQWGRLLAFTTINLMALVLHVAIAVNMTYQINWDEIETAGIGSILIRSLLDISMGEGVKASPIPEMLKSINAQRFMIYSQVILAPITKPYYSAVLLAIVALLTFLKYHQFSTVTVLFCQSCWLKFLHQLHHISPSIFPSPATLDRNIAYNKAATNDSGKRSRPSDDQGGRDQNKKSRSSDDNSGVPDRKLDNHAPSNAANGKGQAGGNVGNFDFGRLGLIPNGRLHLRSLYLLIALAQSGFSEKNYATKMTSRDHKNDDVTVFHVAENSYQKRYASCPESGKQGFIAGGTPTNPRGMMQYLTCPYHLLNGIPCVTDGLRTIADIKQHIRRKHFWCCGNWAFPDKATYDYHHKTAHKTKVICSMDEKPANSKGQMTPIDHAMHELLKDSSKVADSMDHYLKLASLREMAIRHTGDTGRCRESRCYIGKTQYGCSIEYWVQTLVPDYMKDCDRVCEKGEDCDDPGHLRQDELEMTLQKLFPQYLGSAPKTPGGKPRELDIHLEAFAIQFREHECDEWSEENDLIKRPCALCETTGQFLASFAASALDYECTTKTGGQLGENSSTPSDSGVEALHDFNVSSPSLLNCQDQEDEDEDDRIGVSSDLRRRSFFYDLE